VLSCKNLVPGKTAEDVFDMHAKTFDNLGFNKVRMITCSCSLGSTFSLNWMDPAYTPTIHILSNQVMSSSCT